MITLGRICWGLAKPYSAVSISTFDAGTTRCNLMAKEVPDHSQVLGFSYGRTARICEDPCGNRALLQCECRYSAGHRPA